MNIAQLNPGPLRRCQQAHILFSVAFYQNPAQSAYPIKPVAHVDTKRFHLFQPRQQRQAESFPAAAVAAPRPAPPTLSRGPPATQHGDHVRPSAEEDKSYFVFFTTGSERLPPPLKGSFRVRRL